MNLFDVKIPKHRFDKFEVTLNYPLYISDNIFAAKEQGKRVLLEMVDTYPKLILGYSGGMDSGFILCCIRDLIDEGKITEDTIEIVQGIFTGGNVILTLDNERTTKFANSLGFNPRIYKYDINEKWRDCENLILKYKLSGTATVVGSYQILFAMQQDGIIITNQVPPTLKSFHLRGGLRMCSAFDNQINFHTWDSDNYSSYITPFRLNMRKINTQPYNMEYSGNYVYYIDYLSINSLEKYLYLWMIYLQCYPKMFEIFGKFGTINWELWKQKCFNKEIMRLLEFDLLPLNMTSIQLPNGELFTEKHLLNYDEMKEGEK
tara:strand:- start:2329 stop:3282 length:954 start_codon:yes stop_codon:yes gene_type:complete